MDNTALNQAVHKAMGKCWHETRERTLEERIPIKSVFGRVIGFEHSSLVGECVRCGAEIIPCYDNGKPSVMRMCPDYCSEDTPRRYLNELEAFVIEKRGLHVYISALTGMLGKQDGPVPTQEQIITVVTASALQRVRACAKALGIED